jgi:hypothetical protein
MVLASAYLGRQPLELPALPGLDNELLDHAHGTTIA